MPTEVLAQSIVAISDGLKALRSGKLNNRALVLLITHACPRMRGAGPVSKTHVEAVLAGIENLKREYIRS